MEKMPENRVREAQQKFTADVPWRGASGLNPGKVTQYRAKVFKSGNSLALRLPKELGFKEGSVMILQEHEGGYRIVPEAQPKARIDVSGFWGKAPGIRLAPRQDFEERPSTIAARKAKDGA